MSLVGKYIQFDTDFEHYQTGKIVEQITPTLYLFIPDSTGTSPAFMRLFDLELLPDNTFFFDSKDELDAWLNWLQKPDAPAKIIPLKHP